LTLTQTPKKKMVVESKGDDNGVAERALSNKEKLLKWKAKKQASAGKGMGTPVGKGSNAEKLKRLAQTKKARPLKPKVRSGKKAKLRNVQYSDEE
jgi:hypothetical protein